MTDLAILRMADALARHSSGRHALTARNIANADTPGYAAQDLAPFSAQLRDAFAIRSTRAAHLNATNTLTYEAFDDAPQGAESPNGNSVSLPEQIAKASESMDAQDRALAIYGKTLSILRAGLGRR